jgi:hypothetical protein
VPLDERSDAGTMANMASMAALPGGGLIVAKNGVLRRLERGATTAMTVSGTGLVLGVAQVGRFAVSVGEPSALTTDGTTWTPIRVG